MFSFRLECKIRREKNNVDKRILGEIKEYLKEYELIV